MSETGVGDDTDKSDKREDEERIGFRAAGESGVAMYIIKFHARAYRFAN
jgi:hypothetical protein